MLILGAAVAALAVATYVAVRRQEAADRVRGFVEVPMCGLGDCTEGEQVRVVGIVELDERALKAPSDGAKCVFYACDYFSVDYVDGRRIEKRYASSAHGTTFWLTSNGLRARVDAKDLEVTTDDVWVQEIDAGALPTGIRRQLLRSSPDVTPAPCSRYVERRLAPGARVTVVGIARMTEGSFGLPVAAGYREGREPERILTITAPKGARVRASTDEATRR